MNYLYGFASASFAYWVLSYLFPARDLLLDACIYDDPDMMDSGDSAEHGEHDMENPMLSEKRGVFAT
jgi:hypothetical protein